MTSLIALAQSEPIPDTFERWWQVRGDWVEAPNQRRGGESGVQRGHTKSGQLLYIKRQLGHLHRSWRYPLGRPTVLRELHAMQALRALGIRVPALVYGGAQHRGGQWRALLVSEALEGFVSLEQWYAGERPEAGLNLRMLQQLARMLERLHRAGWQHGCLYAKHIFVKPGTGLQGDEVEVALLDLEKSRRRWFAAAASRHGLAQLQRHRGGMPEADWQRLIDYYRLFQVKGQDAGL
jgi:tRNA A-37 threonylcarbamoyl transferase component Bud32